MPTLKYYDTATGTWKLGAVGLPSGQVFPQVIGDGLNTSFTVTHGFGTRNVTVSVYRNTPPYDEVEVDVERTDTNSVTIRTAPTVPGVSAYIAVVAAAGTQASLNVTMDTWHYVGASGEPAFQNSWVNYDNSAASPGSATQRNLRFRKYPDGRVRISGTIKNGSAAAVFTLPVGYRPLTVSDVNLTVAASGGAGYVNIQSNGVVAVAALTTGASVAGYTQLETEFDTESVQYSTSMAAMPLDSWHNVGNPAEPQFGTGYGNLAGYQAVGFRKGPDGRVALKGLMTFTTTPVSAATAFTLPVGYRPPAGSVAARYACASNKGPLFIQILESGAVQWVTLGGYGTPASSDWIDLSSIDFDTETAGAYTSGVIQNQITLDSWHVIGATGEPAFQNSWAAYPSYATPAFRKYPDGKVRLRGGVRNGTAPTIFTLPVGYRPPATVLFSANTAGAVNVPSYVQIDSGGVVTTGGNNAYVPLDFEFDTETVTQTASVAAVPMDPWHYVGASGEPAMANSWLNFDNSLQVPTAGQRNARFRKYPDGRVRLSGLIKSGTIGAAAFTLPVGYRPPVPNIAYSAMAGVAPAQIVINADGTVVPTNIGSSNVQSYVYLDFEFDTETVTSYATGAIANQIPLDVWHQVGATGEPAFGTYSGGSWGNLGGTYSTAAFRKFSDGKVRLRGVVTNSAALPGVTTLFTLPPGYRPAQRLVVIPSSSSTSPARLDIDPNGTITTQVGPSTAGSFFSLDGIEFDTESVLFTASQAAQPMDTWHRVGDPGEPTLAANWTQGNAPYQLGYRKFPDGRVLLRGWVTRSSATFAFPVTVFTLPAGYRPPATRYYEKEHWDNDGSFDMVRMAIFTDGQVQLIGTTTGASVSGAIGSQQPFDGIEFDTETVSSYSSGFVQVDAPTRVTSLPSSPYDGQEVYYVADAANGILWHLRYNASSSSAYKWEFVGGSELRTSSSTSVALNSAPFIELTPLISIILPLAGDYQLGVEGTGTRIGAGAADFQIHPGSAAATYLIPVNAIPRALGTGLSAPNDSISIAREAVATGVAAGTRSAWFGLAGNLTIYWRALTARPVRVG